MTRYNLFDVVIALLDHDLMGSKMGINKADRGLEVVKANRNATLVTKNAANARRFLALANVRNIMAKRFAHKDEEADLPHARVTD